MITVSIDDERTLQNYFDDDCGDSISLKRGVYELDVNHPAFVKISGANPPYTILILHQTVPVSYWSRYQDVTLMPMGDFAAVNLDFGAYSNFDRVLFTSPESNGQNHVGKKWNSADILRSGIGVETTGANDGDNSYTVKFRDCLFSYLEYGLNIQQPATKGTIRWVLEHNIFNAARVAINGKKLGEWTITGGDIQLHETGIDLEESHTNMLSAINFERGHVDVTLSDNSENNFLHFVRVNHWGKKGLNTKVRNPQQHVALMGQEME